MSGSAAGNNRRRRNDRRPRISNATNAQCRGVRSALQTGLNVHIESDAKATTISSEVEMAVRITRSAGMLLLAIWLILTGIAGFAALPIPGVLMAALAVIAGILILIGM